MTLTSTNRRPVIYPRHNEANLPHSTFGSVFSEPYPSTSKSWGPTNPYLHWPNYPRLPLPFLTTFVNVINIKKKESLLSSRLSPPGKLVLVVKLNYWFFFHHVKRKKGRVSGILVAPRKGVFVINWENIEWQAGTPNKSRR